MIYNGGTLDGGNSFFRRCLPPLRYALSRIGINVNLETLEDFCELADCLSFTETARRRNTTQSVISKHLANLEAELGTELVSRTRQKVELTQAGYSLLQGAHAICDEWARTTKRVKKASSLPTLHIGGVWQNPYVQWIISDALAQQEQNQPALSCTYLQGFGKEALAQLEDGEADIIFTSLSEEETENPHPQFSVLKCFEDQFVAVMRATNAASEEPRLSLRKLEGKTLLRLNGPYWSHGWERIRTACQLNGVDVEQRSVSSVPGLDFSLLDIGNDFLILSKSLLTGQLIARNRNYRCIPLDGVGTVFNVCAVWKEGTHNRSLNAFTKALRDVTSARDSSITAF